LPQSRRDQAKSSDDYPESSRDYHESFNGSCQSHSDPAQSSRHSHQSPDALCKAFGDLYGIVVDICAITVAISLQSHKLLNMIGIQSCVSSIQALIMARAVDIAGPKVFSVTVSDGEWIVWFRFDDPRQAESIPRHFNRLWKEQQGFDRRVAELLKPKNRFAPGKKQSKKTKRT
jgi:hypothetical protein